MLVVITEILKVVPIAEVRSGKEVPSHKAIREKLLIGLVVFTTRAKKLKGEEHK